MKKKSFSSFNRNKDPGFQAYSRIIFHNVKTTKFTQKFEDW